ncbi:hypothetical protein BKA62DRAFT_773464 [Auriculariales sp. MPI-PUGE-AT-0066]|nr:hypothetical protein BKA62DRAFT_773464 [Auriculariales sp. MPI-PUGE-AT-0066]
MAVLADDAKRLLGSQATNAERAVLGSAKFFDDMTVTHTDEEYLARHYERTFRNELAAEPQNPTQSSQLRFARDNKFGPMYFTRSYPSDGSKCEMTFDCSNYQPQFAPHRAQSGVQHIYQTLFLDSRAKDLWTKHWHQLGHNWTHYARVVPWLWRINSPGRRTHTQYVGCWTLVNMHEVAVISGIAAACALGADYLAPDKFGEDFFKKYYLLANLGRFKGNTRMRDAE